MSTLPFDMFDKELTDQEAQAARKLESVYHKGQEKIWDGRLVLSELIEKHGIPELPIEKQEALRNIFSMILWGELAAWKISAQLAAEIEPMEAKMAATSQTHDEARHFYVMHDYLELLGYKPSPLNPGSARVLETVAATRSLAKKLLGMQMMVEPVAIAVFRLVRKTDVEPVLCDLLRYYETDESRHIALGIQYLPSLLREMHYHEIAQLFIWQLHVLMMEIDGLQEMEKDFRALGIDPEEAFVLAEKKQLEALKMMGEELGINPIIWEPLRRIVGVKKELHLSSSRPIGYFDYIKKLAQAIRTAFD